MTKVNIKARSLLLFVSACVFASVIGAVCYNVGKNNSEAVSLSMNQVSLPITYSQLIEARKDFQALQLMGQQIDCGIIACVRLQQNLFVSPQNRQKIRYSLSKAFDFRNTHPYVIINTNDLAPDFKNDFESALLRKAADDREIRTSP